MLGPLGPAEDPGLKDLRWHFHGVVVLTRSGHKGYQPVSARQVSLGIIFFSRLSGESLMFIVLPCSVFLWILRIPLCLAIIIWKRGTVSSLPSFPSPAPRFLPSPILAYWTSSISPIPQPIRSFSQILLRVCYSVRHCSTCWEYSDGSMHIPALWSLHSKPTANYIV